MNEHHLTVRLTAALERALNRRARAAGVPRSQLVREAMTAYLADAAPSAEPELTADELAARWSAIPRLSPADATRFADELADARNRVPPPRSWE
jgi:hypothetical protein